DLLDDFHPRVVTVGVDRDHAATRTERACKRRQHAFGLEVERRTRAVRLRSDNEIVICNGPARLRYDLIEQEAVIVSVYYQNDGALVDRVAAFCADPRLPVLGEERLEVGELLLEAVRGVAVHRQLFPHKAGRGAQRFDRQPGSFRVGEIGEYQHRRRMLDEAIRHLVQRQTDVLEADLLADDIEWRGREAVVHGAHHAREHGTVADAGIEYAHRRRAWMDIG